jgi:hypothetical protein
MQYLPSSPTDYLTTYNKTVKLHTNPHYTDNRFKEPQTIFGKPAKSPYGHSHLSYDYSDRLWEWDYDKAEASVEIANKSNVPKGSCLWFEVYLSAYFGYQIELEHIIAGVNHSNGYPYCVYGYKRK